MTRAIATAALALLAGSLHAQGMDSSNIPCAADAAHQAVN